MLITRTSAGACSPECRSQIQLGEAGVRVDDALGMRDVDAGDDGVHRR
jgi:hypothetical protein